MKGGSPLLEIFSGAGTIVAVAVNEKGDDSFTGTERFKVLRKLGEGGMGTVYAATDLDKGVNIALKTIQKSTPDALSRFKREFRALHDIQHPNLIRLGEFIEKDQDFFFTMELVEGETLLNFIVDTPNSSDAISIIPRRFSTPTNVTIDDGELATRDTGNQEAKTYQTIDGQNSEALERVKQAEPLSDPSLWTFNERKLRCVLVQLAQAIHAIHRAGMIHRDLKPSNIMVTPDGRLVVLDFGLVKDVSGGHSLTQAHALGTAAYMSPEQAEAATEIGPATDWYSLGVTIMPWWRWACGRWDKFLIW